MKKIISSIVIFLLLSMFIFTIKSYADTLNNINVTIDKQTVNPNGTVKVNVEFGANLGSYTIDVAYDNNLFEYVSVEGGTANDNGTRVRVYFYDTEGGSNPRNNMNVIFKAKSGITTSNPTNFSITAEGMANPDASVTYDDITTPIVKNLVVEPVYVDYNMALNYTGDVIVNEPKDMELIISSSMGKNYEHTRIVANATAPSGATINLLATDSQNLEHDIIQSGWGSADGDSIGGVNVNKKISTRGLFNMVGNYTITLSLIDRENSDAVIVSKQFNIVVKEKTTETPPENTNTNKPGETNTPQDINNPEETNKPETEKAEVKKENGVKVAQNKKNPKGLPKTGNTIYIVILGVISALAGIYFIIRNKK